MKVAVEGGRVGEKIWSDIYTNPGRLLCQATTGYRCVGCESAVEVKVKEEK